MRNILFVLLAFVGLAVGATTGLKLASWSEGTPAEGMSQILIDIQPMTVTLPTMQNI